MSQSRPERRAKGLVGDAMASFTQRIDGPGGFCLVGHLLLHGTVIVYWFAPYHNAAHFTAFRSRKLNRALGLFSGYIAGLSFDYFVLEHSQHHLYAYLPE